jgi:hypothetical protein
LKHFLKLWGWGLEEKLENFLPFQAIQQKPKKSTPLGAWWVPPPQNVHPKSYFFCDLKTHAKFRNPTITPSGRKVPCGGGWVVVVVGGWWWWWVGGGGGGWVVVVVGGV